MVIINSNNCNSKYQLISEMIIRVEYIYIIERTQMRTYFNVAFVLLFQPQNWNTYQHAEFLLSF